MIRIRKNIIRVSILTLIFSFGCNKSNTDKTNPTDLSNSPQDSLVITLEGIDSVSVFDILESEHELDYKSSAVGNFVYGIDSVQNTSGYYWIYTVNDSSAKIACDKYITNNADIIKWHFRNINP